MRNENKRDFPWAATWSLTLIGAGLSAGVQQVAIAQEAGAEIVGLEEIVITAERRTEDLQKAAMSVSVRSGDELKAEGKYSLAAILEDVPGFEGGAAATVLGSTTSSTDNLAAGLVIRGIPSNVGVSGTNTSLASAAAIYVDGVYEGVGGGYDIDRVEALRGPQGTLYGRSATTGLVSVHTRNPELGRFGGNLSVEAGNYALRHFSGGVNIPTGDTVALRVSGNRYERDGFFDERGGSSVNSDGRVKLLFQPSETFSLMLAAAGQDSKTVQLGTTILLTSPDSTYSITPNPASLSPGSNETRQYWAEVNWDVGFGHLTYLPALRKWTNETAFYSRSSTQSNNQFSSTDKDDFWTHELHLASRPDSILTWQMGTLYYDNQLENRTVNIRYPSLALYRDFAVKRDTKAWGTFAEATYPFATAWRVTGGMRYDSTKVQVNEVFINNANCDASIPGGQFSTSYCLPERLVTATLSGDAGRRTFNKWTYKVRLEHDLTPSNLLYGMVSTGVSPGDVVMTVDLIPTSPTFNLPVPKDIASETLTAYEIGSKNRFLDDTLQINGDVYYYDYGAYQKANTNVNGRIVNGVFTIITSPTDFQVVSAPLTAYGVELEVLYQPTANDRIGLNYSYNKDYFTDMNQPVAGSQATFGDFIAFDDMTNVAPHRASLSYDHTIRLHAGSKLTLGAATRWLSPYKTVALTKTQLNSPTVGPALLPFVQTNDEFVSDLNLTWTSPAGRYSVTGWVRNVFNNQYKTVDRPAETSVQNVNASNLATALRQISAVPYDPRTYGLVLNMKW